MKLLARTSICLALAGPLNAAEAPSGIDWQVHNAATFDKAQQANRLVLIDLVAVWCHWCHVMDKTTYRDDQVQAVIDRHYVAIKADHDARPDLAERYRDYGWPATVVMTADGRELIKRAGYIEAGRMKSLLDRALVMRDQLEPGREAEAFVPVAVNLTPDLREKLEQRHRNTHDMQHGGLRLMQKFLDEDSVMYDLELALRGDNEAEKRARQSLNAAARLLDPEFGGAYQYSTHGDWKHPHYEKIATTQATYLRVYSRAYAQLGDEVFLNVARQVGDYLLEFWHSPEGGFYNSQDADLVQGQKAHEYFALPRSERLAQGVPRIDRNRYASSNGLLVEGLLSLYAVHNDKRYLAAAVQAFDWTLRSRMRDDGGFAHGEADVAGPYLADNLYMAKAMLAIYHVSGQDLWLNRARRLAVYIQEKFARPEGGLLAAVDNGTPVKPLPQIDQNIQAAHFLLQLADEGRAAELQPFIAEIMRYLVNQPVVTSRLSDPGILLADEGFRALREQEARVIPESLEVRDVYL